MEVAVRELCAILKALSDETRLKMLAVLLAEGELCVCDVVEALQITQSKASRHLRYLVNAGYLEDRKDGTWVHYRIARRPGHAQRALLKAISTDLAEGLPAGAGRRLARWRKRKQRDGITCSSRGGEQNG